MEKFGIFELLDALSAITERTDEDKTPPSPAPESNAFQPPSYSAPQEEETPSAKTSAFNAFVARHNSISDKIDRG